MMHTAQSADILMSRLHPEIRIKRAKEQKTVQQLI